MVINQVIFPKHTHFTIYNENQNMLGLQFTNNVALFGYFNTDAILCHATLVCCKCFMMKFII